MLEKQVTCTLHYLADEWRLHKMATAFQLSRQTVRQKCEAINVHLGSMDIQTLCIYIQPLHLGVKQEQSFQGES